MAKTSNNLNFNNMISWLREDLTQNNYQVLDTCEKIPRLPIDLFCEKREDKDKDKDKAIKYLVIIVASINKINEDFQKKLLFYQYYLSSHYDPTDYAIVLAIPDSAKVVTKPFYAEKPEDQEDDFYKQQGFGLWKIKNKKTIDKTTYPAVPLREKIRYDYKKIIVKDDLNLGKITGRILPFIDMYIHDSVKAITTFNPPKFNERYIDYKLLEKALDLKSVSYCNRLTEGISDYLSRKDDDFEFCTNLMKQLWSECAPNTPYPEVHRKFESLLKEINPRYRDHYIHQFQVYLLGTLILDILKNNQKIEEDFEEICTGWMLASTFHDVNYPVQEHDSYIIDFFDQTLGLKQPGSKQPFGLLDFKNNYNECKFSSNIELILHSVNGCFQNNTTEDSLSIETLNKIREFFYYSVISSKNHGILSSIGLLKKLENEIDSHQILIPASAAIALHDDDIWQPLGGLSNDDDEQGKPWIKNVKERAPLKKIEFKKYPLAFLLILCDNIQDWGRHCQDVDFEKQLTAANIRLKDITFSKDNLIIQLFFNQRRGSTGVIDYKMKTLEKMEKLLKSQDIKFTIEFWERQEDKKSEFIFNFN